MTDAQALVLSQELADLSSLISNILNDLTLQLSDAQVQRLQTDSNRLTNLSRQIAISGALAALDAAQSDFNTMTQATSTANAAIAQLKSNAAKIDKIINILGAAVSFGAALVTGPLASVLTAATALAAAAQ